MFLIYFQNLSLLSINVILLLDNNIINRLRMRVIIIILDSIIFDILTITFIYPINLHVKQNFFIKYNCILHFCITFLYRL